MFKIGFHASDTENPTVKQGKILTRPAAEPRKSVVLIHFPARNMTLPYYNDAFDLHRGDIVYVDGKLEGLRGRVVDVTYSFKIRLSDYKRVISVADTAVKGKLHFAGSHFVTFDQETLTYEQVITWFKAPEKEGEVYVSGKDETGFRLDDLGTMGISGSTAERGRDDFLENRVRYIAVDGSHGRAIVEGTHPYELEFEYANGEIRDLTCGCFCSYPCKHQFAAMLQLKETLKLIGKYYAGQYEESGYFAAVFKGTLLEFAIDSRETGHIVL